MPSSPAQQLRLSIAVSKSRILVIQTNVSGRLSVWLCTNDGRVIAKEKKAIVWHGSEQMLALVDTLLRRTKTKITDIVGMVAVRGPGPFTAVRTGLVVANTFGMMLDVPVRGVVSAIELPVPEIRSAVTRRWKEKMGTIVRPWYGREPNITWPRSKA